MATKPCAECGGDVNLNAKKGIAFKVEGWVERRIGGGAHAVRYQKRLGPVVHVACLDELENPGMGNQGALFR